MKNGKVAIIGLVGQSAFFDVARFPHPGETVQSSALFFEIGGKGYNQAIASARMGADTVFIGAVGDDLYAEQCQCALKAEHIDGLLLRKPAPTAFAAITRDSTGENTVQVFPGAAKALTADDLYKPVVRQALEGCTYLLLQNELREEVLRAAIMAAQEANVPVILNPAPASETIRKLLTQCTVITPNFEEAKLLLGFSAQNQPADEELALAAQAAGVERAIITDGGRGIVLIEHQTATRLLAFRFGSPLDTTGAGDTFNGYFTACLAQGKNFFQAAVYAVVAAGISVTRSGAVAGIPTCAEVCSCVCQYLRENHLLERYHMGDEKGGV